jgi:hypothetical protein
MNCGPVLILKASTVAGAWSTLSWVGINRRNRSRNWMVDLVSSIPNRHCSSRFPVGPPEIGQGSTALL